MNTSLHAAGVNFSNGASFAINMDQLQLDNGTVFSVFKSVFGEDSFCYFTSAQGGSTTWTKYLDKRVIYRGRMTIFMGT
jgi:hypothetical protein